MVDKKRVYGPENSIAVTGESKARTRLKQEHRKIYIDRGILKNATGSCFLEHGNQKIICSIYGPKQSINAIECTINFDFKFAPFSCQKRKGFQKDEQEREFSLALEQALTCTIRQEFLKGTRLDVYCYVLEADGFSSALASSVTCCSIALIDAGIQVYDLCVGSSLGMCGDDMLVDLEEKDEQEAQGGLVVCSMCSLNQITLVSQIGRVSVEDSCRVRLLNH